jgi:hypothetical protein
VRTFCDRIEERQTCESFRTECEQEGIENLIGCVANRFAQADNLEAANQTCFTHPTAHLRHYCSATILSEVDLNASLAQCDLIEWEPERYHCRADMLRKRNLEAALSECQRITTHSDYVYFCQASVYVVVNETKVSENCNLIINPEMKASCKAIFLAGV